MPLRTFWEVADCSLLPLTSPTDAPPSPRPPRCELAQQPLIKLKSVALREIISPVKLAKIPKVDNIPWAELWQEAFFCVAGRRMTRCSPNAGEFGYI